MQNIFFPLFIIFNLLLFAFALYETKLKENAFGLVRPLVVIGAFVWGDVVILAPFWIAVSLFAFVLHDWILFLLFTSIFWLIRSIGETIYWFNQQFSPINRNPVESLLGRHLFRNDSLWFAHQLVWQCVSVFSCVATIRLTWLWLR